MSNIITPTHWEKCSKIEKQQLLQRPNIFLSENISQIVRNILITVKKEGDTALRKFSTHFDNIELQNLFITSNKICAANNHLNNTLKEAMAAAVANIETFHNAQKLKTVDVETQPGVHCQQIIRPIQSVGLYIPGRSAPLFSTVLMLATPARIAGCGRVVLCSPPPISDEILYAAQLCGVKEILQIGGAQAIAALAFGTETLPKVDKIFGPGNIYVTEAKRQVSQDIHGAMIDMPAGPSEMLIIADNAAIPEFVAADLLSQAEHGPDSQVILVTPSLKLAENVAVAIEVQLSNLPRKNIIRQSLAKSHLIVVKNLEECISISNFYGPEHLLIQTRQARDLVNHITNAGSIFLGNWSPESAGDYASGTNHVLPTHGHTTAYSSLSLYDFQKRMTVQELTPQGLCNLASILETLATAEQLEAHKNAVVLRIATLKENI